MALLQLPKNLHPDFQKKDKPLSPVEIDWSNPLAPDRQCILFEDAVRELVYGDVLDLEGGEAHRVIDAGSKAQKFDGTQLSSYALKKPINEFVAGDEWSITWKGRNNIGNSSDTVFCGISGQANNYVQMRATDAFRVAAGGTSYTIIGLGTNIWDNSDWNSLVFTSNGYILYKNGKVLGEYTGANDPAKVQISSVGNGYSSANYAFDGFLEAFYVHSRPLSAGQVEKLHADPYQILKPATPQFYFVPDGAGGGTNVNASTEVLTITEQAASVTLDVNVSTGTELLAITSYQAVVDVGGATTVQAETQPLTVTGQQASIGYDVGVNASTESLTLTTNAASVALGANVEASVESLSITGHTASIERDVGVEASTEALTISTHAADIESQGATTLTPQDITNIVDALFAKVIENGETFEQQLKLIRAEAAGKVAVSGNTVSFRDAADSKDRIVATVDEQGQRTAITTDVS